MGSWAACSRRWAWSCRRWSWRHTSSSTCCCLRWRGKVLAFPWPERSDTCQSLVVQIEIYMVTKSSIYLTYRCTNKHPRVYVDIHSHSDKLIWFNFFNTFRILHLKYTNSKLSQIVKSNCSRKNWIGLDLGYPISDQGCKSSICGDYHSARPIRGRYPGHVIRADQSDWIYQNTNIPGQL